MSLIFNGFLNNLKFEDLSVKNTSGISVVLLDIDPEYEALLKILKRLDVNVSRFNASNIIPKVRYYNNGNIKVREGLFSELSSLDKSSLILMVSSDVDSKLREVVDVSNKVGLKTACLYLGQKQYGAFKYESIREGYRYGISDKLMFVDPLMHEEVSSRGLGVSSCSIVSSQVSGSDIGTKKKDICLVEEAEKTKLDLLFSLLSKSFKEIYVRKGLLNKDEAKKYKDYIQLIEPGVGYRQVYTQASAIFSSNDQGFYCDILGDLHSCGVISSLKEKFISSDKKIELTSSSYLNVEKLESELQDLLSSEKASYRTLALSVKKGRNLFDALRYYPRLLGCENHIVYRGEEVDADVFAVFGLPSDKAKAEVEANAALNSAPVYNLENGFLGFTGIALLESAVSYSIIKDSRSIYFNGMSGSSVEDTIFSSGPLSDAEVQNVRRIIDRITKNCLTKYNHSPIFTPVLPGQNKKKVLIIDQRYADKSISYAGADENTFKLMLGDALKENPESDIIVKVHPDALTGLVSGHYHLSVEDIERVYFYDENINSVSLLNAVDSVYVVSSQMGFEALLLDKTVNAYGVSIYSGWGLTNDRIEIPRRLNKKASLEQVFKILYIDSVSYVNPVDGKSCGIDSYIDGMMASRKIVPNPKDIINVGVGAAIFNPVMNKYFIDKQGSVTLNTLFSLMMLEKNKEKRVKISKDVLPSFFNEDSNNLACSLFLVLEKRVKQREFLLEELVSFKLNDAFKVLVTYYEFWDKDLVNQCAEKLMDKSNSEVFLEKVRSWLSNISG